MLILYRDEHSSTVFFREHWVISLLLGEGSFCELKHVWGIGFTGVYRNSIQYQEMLHTSFRKGNHIGRFLAIICHTKFGALEEICVMI